MFKKTNIFYHLFCDNDKYCMQLFDGTLQKIKQSGLLNEANQLCVNLVGNVDNEILKFDAFKHEKIKLSNNCSDGQGESDTLKLLWDFCQTHADNAILYLHSKGVSRRGSENVMSWVRYMEYFNIEKWSDCHKVLETHDTCGVNLQELPGKCYAGNFWWANSNYVKRIPRFDISNCTIPLHRFYGHPVRAYSEFWLLDNTFCRPASLHNSNIDHYGSMYDETNYKI